MCFTKSPSHSLHYVIERFPFFCSPFRPNHANHQLWVLKMKWSIADVYAKWVHYYVRSYNRSLKLENKVHPINDRHAIVTFLKLGFFFRAQQIIICIDILCQWVAGPGYLAFLMGKWMNGTVEERRTDNDLMKIGSIRCMDWDRKSLHWMDFPTLTMYVIGKIQ